MCDVALLPCPAPPCTLATLVSAEVVMTGTQWQLQTTASCPGAALPTLDMSSPALTRNIGPEERSTAAAAALEINSTVMQACLTDDSEDQQKHQEG